MSRHCVHDVVTTCLHCAALAVAERLIRESKPAFLEVAEFAQLILKTLQARGDFGPRSHEDILRVYRDLCDEQNLMPVQNPTRNLLREFGEKGIGLTKTRRENPDGSTTTYYIIPKPMPAKVVAIDRRLQATSS